MVEDYPSTSNAMRSSLTNMLLRDLNDLLLQHGKQITNYDLPELSLDTTQVIPMPRVIQEELSVQIPIDDINYVSMLNNDQLFAYNTFLDVIKRNQSQVFFVDGSGGTGKTFLYRTLIATLRSNCQIVLATASSGIAATLLPGGRTAHSRFKIPINVDEGSLCSISKQSDLAKLIRETTTIIWDEVPMTNRYALEALDRTLKDILDCDAPFGGKVMIMEGNFRQVLPVVPKGTKAQTISACIFKSHLWTNTKVLHLRKNMRSLQDQDFADFLMRIGNGIESTKHDDMVSVPHQIAIPWEGESSVQILIQQTFPQLEDHGWDASYMVERAILTPKNEDAQKLNNIIIEHFSGGDQNLLSYGEVEEDTRNLYQHEYLNSIALGGFPHIF